MSNFPRVTEADLVAEIASEHYFTAGDAVRYNIDRPGVFGTGPKPSSLERLDLLTFCVLVLKNGITVVGKSVCVSAGNFKPEVGRSLARGDALEQLWPLLGFRLADKLAGIA